MTMHPIPKKQRPVAKLAPVANRRPRTLPDWRELCAEDVMQTDVVTVAEGALLSEVETLLAENRIGGLPVTDEAGNVVGVLSLRDLVDRYTEDPEARPRRGATFYQFANGEPDDDEVEALVPSRGSEETAGDVMTRQVLAVAPTTSLREVAREMVRRNVHRLLVNKDERMVGIISTMDLLRAAAK